MQDAEPSPRHGSAPPPTDAERLWKRYQLPAGKPVPDDRLPMGRHDWNLLVLRLDIPTHVKAIAAALSALCKADGSNVVTTDPCLPAAFGINERQLRRHIAVLHDLKLLEVMEQPGGRGVTKTVDEKRRVHGAIVCQLTEPADGALPYRLDAQFLPIEHRGPGAAPLKAIEASRIARARNTGSESAAVSADAERNPGSRATGATAKHRQPGYRSNSETPVAGLPEQGQNTGSGATDVSGSAPWKLRQPGYRSNDETPVAGLPGQERNTGTPATGETATQPANPGSPATAETPVDNPQGDEKPRYSGYRSSPETPVAGLPKPRYSGYRGNENPGSPATGAASRVEVLKTLKTNNPSNPTTRVVQLGDQLTSGPGDDAENPIDPATPADSPTTAPPASTDPQPPSTAAAAAFQPSDDPEYDDARALVATVPLDELGELLANAQAELEADYGERAGTYDARGFYAADQHQILIRAAEILRRTEPAAHPATEGTESCP